MLRLIIFILLSLSFFNIAAAKELKVNVLTKNQGAHKMKEETKRKILEASR